jgi:hypothetical protein
MIINKEKTFFEDNQDKEEGFLHALIQTSNNFRGVVDNLLYRGQADTSLPLLPSAFREDKKKRLIELNNFETHGAFKKANDIKKTKNIGMSFYELMAIAMFYRLANEQALPLPPVKYELHHALLQSINDMAFNCPSIRCGKWPTEELLPIMALAQHYGFPTRLLDWSIDPLVAAYFAASGGMKDISEGNSKKTQKIGVWLANALHFKRTEILRYVNVENERLKIFKSIAVIDAPYSSNPNLAAQKGRFTTVLDSSEQFGTKSEECYKPLDKVYGDICIEAEEKGLIKTMLLPDEFDSSKVFTKITLPISRAPFLLNRLYQLGYNASRIFPGYSGCIKSVNELLEIRKHV